MVGRKAEAAWLRFAVFSESALEASLTFVLAVVLEGVDEEEVSAAGSEDPVAVCRDVETDDGFAEGGDGGFGAEAELVEESDVAFLGGDGYVAFLGGCGGGEGVFAGVLFVFRVDELVAGEAGVDAVEGIIRDAEEGLLAGHLGEFLGTVSIGFGYGNKE